MEVSGQIYAPAALPPRERAPGTHWIGGWVGPRAVLGAVVKRKIPNPRRESNPITPIVQPVAQCYTDWAITALSLCKLEVGRNISVPLYLLDREKELCQPWLGIKSTFLVVFLELCGKKYCHPTVIDPRCRCDTSLELTAKTTCPLFSRGDTSAHTDSIALAVILCPNEVWLEDSEQWGVGANFYSWLYKNIGPHWLTDCNIELEGGEHEIRKCNKILAGDCILKRGYEDAKF
jgi:hypothetical protein